MQIYTAMIKGQRPAKLDPDGRLQPLSVGEVQAKHEQKPAFRLPLKGAFPYKGGIITSFVGKPTENCWHTDQCHLAQMALSLATYN
jgi:hypothetical protein